MKTLEKIFKIIAAIILIPTVLLVVFILYADATDMDFKKKEEVSTESTTEAGQESDTEESVTEDGESEETVVETSDMTERSGQEAEVSVSQVSGGKIDAQKYEQIQNDMTYQDLVSLIGEEGKKTAESENQGSKTTMYEWTAEDGWGTAIIVLQDNRVINKSQTGIAESVQTVPITLTQYDKIEEGMTYDKVVEIVGGDGEAISESGEEDALTVVYIWNGADGISNATITFYNNAVFSKAQTGLL